MTSDGARLFVVVILRITSAGPEFEVFGPWPRGECAKTVIGLRSAHRAEIEDGTFMVGYGPQRAGRAR